MHWWAANKNEPQEGRESAKMRQNPTGPLAECVTWASEEGKNRQKDLRKFGMLVRHTGAGHGRGNNIFVQLTSDILRICGRDAARPSGTCAGWFAEMGILQLRVCVGDLQCACARGGRVWQHRFMNFGAWARAA